MWLEIVICASFKEIPSMSTHVALTKLWQAYVVRNTTHHALRISIPVL